MLAVLGLEPGHGNRSPKPELAALGQIAVTLSYDNDHPGPIGRHPTLTLSLLLARGGSGVVGVIGPSTSPGGDLTEVSWRATGGGIELARGSLHLDAHVNIDWSTFHLVLKDSNGDGVLDSGSGAMSGGWHAMIGDVADYAGYRASLRVSPDTTAPTATLAPASGRDPGFSLASEGIHVLFSEPVDWDSVRTRTRLLAAGSPVEAKTEAGRVVLGLVTRATIKPSRDIDFDTELGLDVGGVGDPAGNLATWDRRTFRVPRDPGGLLTNPGFENGLKGWISEGSVQVVSDLEGTSPAEGTRQAVLYSNGRLEGYMDVPANAGKLTFSATIFSEIGEFVAGSSVIVTVAGPGGQVYALDAENLKQQGAPCTCKDFGERIGPVPVEVDLVPFRGQRVTISAHVRSTGYIGMNYYGLVLDDFRIHS
jgi:hypothetical protein